MEEGRDDEQTEIPAKYQHICSRCRGHNGIGEFCHHCGGDGFEPVKGGE